MVRCGRLITDLAHSLLVIDYMSSLCIVVYRVHCMHMFDVTFLIEMVLILFTTALRDAVSLRYSFSHLTHMLTVPTARPGKLF